MPSITTLPVPFAPNIPEYAESEGLSSTTSGTYQDKTTLTFTAEAGDYLVIWSCEQYVSAGTGNGDYRLYNSTDAVEYSFHHNNTVEVSDPALITGMKKITLTAGSKTLKIQWLANAGTAYIQRARIYIVKLNV